MPNERAESATPTARHAIAAQVRAEIARAQKSQREIGEILGLPQPSVQVRLKGERAFRAEELVLLAEALCIPTERLLPSSPTSPAVGAS